MSGTLDPEYHRPEGMEMAGRVDGVRPGDECENRLIQAEEALREAYHLCCEEGFALGDWEKIAAYHDDFLEERPEGMEMAGRVAGVRPDPCSDRIDPEEPCPDCGRRRVEGCGHWADRKDHPWA